MVDIGRNITSKLLSVLLMLTASVCLLNAQTTPPLTIHLSEAGKLSSMIDQSKLTQITELTLSGYMNGYDVSCVKKMSGLLTLNMEKVDIVAGGPGGFGYNTENATIGYEFFTGCYKLNSVVLPNSVLFVRHQAFDKCIALETIKIGKSLKEIHIQAFLNGHNGYQHASRTCWKLKEFVVHNENQYFSTVDGVLFNKEKTELLFYPNANAKEYKLPEGTTSIRTKAFSCCNNLMAVVLPKSLTSVGRDAFESCNLLVKVQSLAVNPPKVEEYAFYNVDLNVSTLYVPIGTYSSYWLSPGWGKFKNIVETNDLVTSITDQIESHFTVVKVGSEVVINCSQYSSVFIFNIAGENVYQNKLNGRVHVPLTRGLYIVKVNGKSIKIVL